MSELDYLRGEWDAFKEFEKSEHAAIKEDLKEIKRHVETLRIWKASVVGMALAVLWIATH